MTALAETFRRFVFGAPADTSAEDARRKREADAEALLDGTLAQAQKDLASWDTRTKTRPRTLRRIAEADEQIRSILENE